MPTEQSQRYCPACQRQVLVERPTANHLIHGLVTLFTCGLWALVWLVAALRPSVWRCAFCGGADFSVSRPWVHPGPPAVAELPEVEPDTFEPPKRG